MGQGMADAGSAPSGQVSFQANLLDVQMQQG
jgi:hypothetical protein